MNKIFTPALLLAAAVASAASTTVTIDNFTTYDDVSVKIGTQTGTTITGIGAYGIFDRTLSVTGNRNSWSALSIDELARQIIASTPANSGSLTTFNITYGTGGSSVNFLINQDVVNTHLDLTLLTSDTASSFTWTALVTGQSNSNTLTYTQAYGITTNPTTYSISLGDFTNNTTVSRTVAWQNIRQLTLTINPATAMDATFSNGFYLTQSTPVPEPSTYGIALGALALVGAVIRRRRSK